MGVELGPDEVAYRCNLVTLGADGTMVDFAAGHLSSEQSHPIVDALDAALGGGRDGVRFHAGVEYRHLVVTPRRLGRRRVHAAARPHREAGDLPDRSRRREAHRADGRVAAGRGRRGGPRSIRSRRRSGCGARGVRPTLPRFAERFGVDGRLTSAVDLVRGLGVLADIEVLDVPGASAGFDNDYGAQRDACLESLADRDFFLLHVEATDEAGHQQNAAEKVRALESWDREIIGPLLEALPAFGPHRRAAPARTTRRRSGSARTPRIRCRTCCSTPRSRSRGGRTPRRAPRAWRPSRRTSSWGV